MPGWFTYCTTKSFATPVVFVAALTIRTGEARTSPVLNQFRGWPQASLQKQTSNASSCAKLRLSGSVVPITNRKPAVSLALSYVVVVVVIVVEGIVVEVVIVVQLDPFKEFVKFVQLSIVSKS
jgi:hypothetical protein